MRIILFHHELLSITLNYDVFTIRLPISCFFAARCWIHSEIRLLHRLFDPPEHQLPTTYGCLKQMLVGHCQIRCGVRCDFSSGLSFIMSSNAVCIGRRERFICKNMLIESSQKPIRFHLASWFAYVTRCCCSSLMFKVEKNVDSPFVLFGSLFITFIRRLPLRWKRNSFRCCFLFVCQ